MAAAKVCSVGCKLPQGLIIELDYRVVGGGIVRGANYARITLAGANQHSIIRGTLRDPSPANLQPGITDNVDEEAFDKWLADHKDTNLVKNMLVFKANSHKEAEAIAKEVTTEKTGLEAIDPSKVRGIEPATEGEK